MPFCPMCGARVVATHRFCAHCGATLSVQESASPPQLEPPPDDPSRVGVRDLLGSVAIQQSPRPRRVVVAVGMVGLLIGSAVGGYLWFRPASGTPTNAPGTDQVVDERPPTRQLPPSDSERMWTLVADATRETADADAILGKPDGRVAVIRPGGALAIAIAGDRPFYNGAGADVRLDGPAGDPAPYTIFARGGSQDKWLRFDVNPKGFPNGFALHDFGHHQLEEARQILIRNDGRVNLSVDAVTPLHIEPETDEAPHGPGGDPHRPR